MRRRSAAPHAAERGSRHPRSQVRGIPGDTGVKLATTARWRAPARAAAPGVLLLAPGERRKWRHLLAGGSGIPDVPTRYAVATSARRGQACDRASLSGPYAATCCVVVPRARRHAPGAIASSSSLCPSVSGSGAWRPSVSAWTRVDTRGRASTRCRAAAHPVGGIRAPARPVMRPRPSASRSDASPRAPRAPKLADVAAVNLRGPRVARPAPHRWSRRAACNRAIAPNGYAAYRSFTILLRCLAALRPVRGRADIRIGKSSLAVLVQRAAYKSLVGAARQATAHLRQAGMIP